MPAGALLFFVIKSRKRKEQYTGEFFDVRKKRQ